MNILEQTILNNCPPLAPLLTDVQPQLNPLSGVKAVLFDVYGTLFVSGSGDIGTVASTDTAEALTQALVVAGFAGELEQAGRIGKEMLKEEVLRWHAAGKKAGADYPEVEITKIWKTIIDRLGGTETLTTANPEIEEIRRLAMEYECRINPTYPMPQARHTIETLNNQGTTLGIVSNAQFYTPLLFSAFLEKSVEACGFDPDLCIWSFRELKAKPSATLFPKAAKKLQEKYGVSLSETVYVGNDMLNDIFCAQQAGCKTVLFAGDQRSLRLRETDARCAGIQPDAIITSLDQLLEII